jgi:hypothetical protein
MSYGDYLHCEGCDGKAIYIPYEEGEEDLSVWHKACLEDHIARLMKPEGTPHTDIPALQAG